MARVLRSPALWIPLALVLAVGLLYWPVRTHDFVNFDDEIYLLQNPHVLKGLDWREIGWVLTHSHAANYHPLTWIAHMLDVELFGLAPGPHHLMNAGLHALNAVLVFFLGRALLGGPWTAGLAAALFALHPLRVESVAWASERKDVLCAAFFLGALLLWLRYGRAPSPARYLTVLLCFGLALLAKPMAVTFPCVALLLDLWPLGRLELARPWRPALDAAGRRSARVWLEKLPFVLLATLAAVSTWIAQEVGGAADARYAPPLGLRLENALASYGAYLRETFVPVPLVVFHPLASALSDDPHAELRGPALAAGLVLAFVSVLAWRARRRAPWFLVGWCWFLGTLVPVIGLKQVGAQAHADRYTYLPLLGVAWIVAGGIGALARRLTMQLPGATSGSTAGAKLVLGARRAAGAIAVLGLLALARTTRAQLAVWRDTPSLFGHALAVDERNYMAHASLGAYWLEQGEHERARASVRRALELYPLDIPSLCTLGRIELQTGRLEEAERALRRALRIQPSKWVRYHLGTVLAARGDPAGATREFEAALRLDPSLVDAHFNLGRARLEVGERTEAQACFERALRLDPEHAGAHNGLGVLALEAGDLAAAERHFLHAAEADPEYADARNNLGVALERQGRTAEARARFAEARALYAEQGR